jgi:putative redox protein
MAATDPVARRARARGEEAMAARLLGRAAAKSLALREPFRDSAPMVTIRATYAGDLCCTAVHGPSGSTLQTDAPKDNDGLGRFFSPTDLVATALGTCILTTMGIVARRNGIELRGASVTVEKHMQSSPRRIARLPCEVRVAGAFSADQKKLLEATAHACPVHKSLHPDIDAPIRVVWDS